MIGDAHMKKEDTINKLLDLLDKIEEESSNEEATAEIRRLISIGDVKTALSKIEKLKEENTIKLVLPNQKSKENKKKKETEKDEIDIELEDEYEDEDEEEDSKKEVIVYPKELQNPELEKVFIGLLLNNPKSISMYYFVFEDCHFEDPQLLNVYKSVLFTEGARYSSEIAKREFNFPRENKKSELLKLRLKNEISENSYNSLPINKV